VQAEDVASLKHLKDHLQRMGIQSKQQTVFEGGVEIQQTFFHDPGELCCHTFIPHMLPLYILQPLRNGVLPRKVAQTRELGMLGA
jgi:hypothetical protein